LGFAILVGDRRFCEYRNHRIEGRIRERQIFGVGYLELDRRKSLLTSIHKASLNARRGRWLSNERPIILFIRSGGFPSGRRGGGAQRLDFAAQAISQPGPCGNTRWH